jgi:hypothetical protein
VVRFLDLIQRCYPLADRQKAIAKALRAGADDTFFLFELFLDTHIWIFSKAHWLQHGDEHNTPSGKNSSLVLIVKCTTMFRRRFGLIFTFCIMHLLSSYIWHASLVDAIIKSLMYGVFGAVLSVVNAAADAWFLQLWVQPHLSAARSARQSQRGGNAGCHAVVPGCHPAYVCEGGSILVTLYTTTVRYRLHVASHSLNGLHATASTPATNFDVRRSTVHNFMLPPPPMRWRLHFVADCSRECTFGVVVPDGTSSSALRITVQE